MSRPRPFPPAMVEDAIEAILAYYSALEAPISESDLLDRSRDAYTVKVRAVVMHFLKTEGQMSYPALGRRFERDHTTVINMVRRVHDMVTLEDLEDVARYVQARVARQMQQRHADLMAGIA